MFRFFVRLWMVGCAAALVLIISARVLGERRERQWLAFIVKPGFNRDLYVVDVPMRFKLNTSRLWASGESCDELHPTWSNDKRLAFVHVCQAGISVKVLDFNTGRLIHLTDPMNVWYWNLDWSPDGRIALAVQIADHNEVQIVDSRTGAIKIVHSDTDSGMPVWLPDGRLIFRGLASATNPTSNMRSLLLREVDGSIRAVTPPLSNLRLIAASPDRSRLAYFYSNITGAFIDIFDTTTDRVTNTLPFNDVAVQPVWSPEDQLIISVGQIELVTLDVYSGTKAKLTQNDDLYETWPQWSKEGLMAYLAYTRPNGKLGVYLEPSSGSPIRIDGGLEVALWPLAWSR